MNQDFDSNIFGETIIPTPCQNNNNEHQEKSIQMNPLSQSQISDKEKWFNDYKFGKCIKNLGEETEPSSSYTETNKKWKKGITLSQRNSVSSSQMPLSKISQNVQLRKVNETGNFYCSCKQNEDKSSQCVICKSKGSISGNNNLVKFIEYVMQFKFGVKDSYLPKIHQEQESQEKEVKQNTSILFPEMTTSKKLTSLSTKPSLKTLRSNSSNRINSFCTEFLKGRELDTSKLSNNSSTGSSFFSNIPCSTTKKTIQTNQSTEAANESELNAINLDFGGRMGQSIKYSGIEEDEEQAIESLQVLNKGFSKDSREQMQRQRQEAERRRNNASCYGGVNEKDSQNFDTYSLNSKSVIVRLGKQRLADARMSMPCKQMDFGEFKAKINMESNIHLNITCDKCGVNPIIGTRYHCQYATCNNDYDLCEKCYKKIGHDHPMSQIKCNKLLKICQNFEKCSNKSYRSTNRLSMGSRNANNSKLLKSKEQESYEYDQRYKPVFKSSIH